MGWKYFPVVGKVNKMKEKKWSEVKVPEIFSLKILGPTDAYTWVRAATSGFLKETKIRDSKNTTYD